MSSLEWLTSWQALTVLGAILPIALRMTNESLGKPLASGSPYRLRFWLIQAMFFPAILAVLAAVLFHDRGLLIMGNYVFLSLGFGWLLRQETVSASLARVINRRPRLSATVSLGTFMMTLAALLYATSTML